MAKVRLQRQGFCPVSGKLKHTAEEIVFAMREVESRIKRPMYSFLCKHCQTWHLTHLNQERYVDWGPRTHRPEMIGKPFPRPLGLVARGADLEALRKSLSA